MRRRGERDKKEEKSEGGGRDKKEETMRRRGERDKKRRVSGKRGIRESQQKKVIIMNQPMYHYLTSLKLSLSTLYSL